MSPMMQIQEEPMGTKWFVLMWLECLTCNVAKAGELEEAKRRAMTEFAMAKTVRRSHVFG